MGLLNLQIQGLLKTQHSLTSKRHLTEFLINNIPMERMDGNSLNDSTDVGLVAD